VLLALLTLPALAVAYETAMHFSGVAIDGPFQLYDALRRIDAGFRPGVDFQFFHGLGIPYTHYWLYRLFGGGLRGSELARELLATALYPVEFVLAFRAFTGSWRRALALAAAAMAFSYVFRMVVMLFAVNGMLSLRSAPATLVPALVAIAATRRARIIWPGVGLGIALFMSTEQGLAVLAAFVLVSAVVIPRADDRRAAALDLLFSLGVAVATLVVALLLVGGFAGLAGALRYNFRIVPMDQYWYFGAPPNTFISSWRAAVQMLLLHSPTIGGAISLSIVATVIYLRRLWIRGSSASPVDIGLALLATYALVSCSSELGIFTGAYVMPCWRCLVIIGLVELGRWSQRSDARVARRPILGVTRASAIVTFAFSAIALVTVAMVVSALGTALPHIVRDHLFGNERFSIAGIWPETLREDTTVVNRHRRADGTPPVVWSTYAGWLEARSGIFHPSFDYIIHALGPANRAAYVETFRTVRPGLVQTVRPTYTQYELWLENENWAFYDALLDGYRVSSMTPWSIFWEPRAQPAPAPQPIGVMNVPAGMTSVPFPLIPATPAAPITLVEVEVEYEVRNPLKFLPVVGALPRYLIGIDGALTRVPVSLDPYRQRVRFPVLVGPGQAPTLHFRTFSLLPGASWTPKTLRLFARPVDAGSQPWLNDAIAYLTKGA
jgi:hypothetical protein